MSDEPLLPGRPYLLKSATRTVGAAVSDLKHQVDIESLQAARGQDPRPQRHRPRAISRCPSRSPSTSTTRTRPPAPSSSSTASPMRRWRPGMIRFGLRRATNIHWQAINIDRQARADAQGPEAGDPVVHRPVRRRQVDHRQPGRDEAPPDGPPHLHARRRQRPPRAQPRPRLHRRRPGREHPPRRRDGEALRRRRADRAGLVHLAVPLRARHGARHGGRGRVPRDLRRRAARRGRGARPEGPLQEGAGRRDQALHRHRFALRAAAQAGRPPRHDRRPAPTNSPTASSRRSGRAGISATGSDAVVPRPGAAGRPGTRAASLRLLPRPAVRPMVCMAAAT